MTNRNQTPVENRAGRRVRIEDFNQRIGDLITSVSSAVRVLPNRVAGAIARANSGSTSEQDRHQRIAAAIEPELAAISGMNEVEPRWPKLIRSVREKPGLIDVESADEDFKRMQDTFRTHFVVRLRVKLLGIKATEVALVTHQIEEFYNAAVDDIVDECQGKKWNTN